MADLTYLNEGAVLHNLKQRYYYKLIYVSTDVQTKLTDSFFLSLSLSSPIGSPSSIVIWKIYDKNCIDTLSECK